MGTVKEFFDTAIIGAGAAGLMTAIMTARKGKTVLLLDSQKKIGAKILMSGGTRCNVTNHLIRERDYETENLRTLRNVLRNFSSEKTVQFFQDLGVELHQEPGGKYFPRTHSAKTILDALVREVERLGISLATGCKVSRVSHSKGLFFIEGENFRYSSRTAVIASGGLSYPTTGSDGSGYALAKSIGHSLVMTSPALTPLVTMDPEWKTLSGVALPCQLKLHSTSENIISEDALLFTHFGFSGPCALNISRFWVRSLSPEIFANFLPQLAEPKLRQRLTDSFRQGSKTSIKNFLADFLPERFAEFFLKKIALPPQCQLHKLKRDERETLIRLIYRYPLPVDGVFGYKKAEVTAGGVDLAELDSRTLESKIQPCLYFAGEILDVDGRIGGFNFQWAWASGVAVSEGIAQKLKALEPSP